MAVPGSQPGMTSTPHAHMGSVLVVQVQLQRAQMSKVTGPGPNGYHRVLAAKSSSLPKPPKVMARPLIGGVCLTARDGPTGSVLVSNVTPPNMIPSCLDDWQRRRSTACFQPLMSQGACRRYPARESRWLSTPWEAREFSPVHP